MANNGKPLPERLKLLIRQRYKAGLTVRAIRHETGVSLQKITEICADIPSPNLNRLHGVAKAAKDASLDN